MPEELLWTKNL